MFSHLPSQTTGNIHIQDTLCSLDQVCPPRCPRNSQCPSNFVLCLVQLRPRWEPERGTRATSCHASTTFVECHVFPKSLTTDSIDFSILNSMSFICESTKANFVPNFLPSVPPFVRLIQSLRFSMRIGSQCTASMSVCVTFKVSADIFVLSSACFMESSIPTGATGTPCTGASDAPGRRHRHRPWHSFPGIPKLLQRAVLVYPASVYLVARPEGPRRSLSAACTGSLACD